MRKIISLLVLAAACGTALAHNCPNEMKAIDAKLIGGQQYEKLYERIGEWEKATGAKVNIEDDGTVKVASNDGEAMKAAIKWIKSIASDPEIGQIYEGTSNMQLQTIAKTVLR